MTVILPALSLSLFICLSCPQNFSFPLLLGMILTLWNLEFWTLPDPFYLICGPWTDSLEFSEMQIWDSRPSLELVFQMVENHDQPLYKFPRWWCTHHNSDYLFGPWDCCSLWLQVLILLGPSGGAHPTETPTGNYLTKVFLSDGNISVAPCLG